MNQPAPDAAPDDIAQALKTVQTAASAGQLSATASAGIQRWLQGARYRPYRAELLAHLNEGRFAELEAAFWTVLPFGTAGRRGPMYPIGTAAINDDTIGESAQGVADYVRRWHAGATALRAAIGFDVRHRSRQYARLCAEIMAAAGFQVYLLSQPRSTPALALAVRHFGCQCGLMITASHNPPSDNAIKVFWSHGGQIRPPHDEAIVACVSQVEQIARTPFDQAVAEGRIVVCEAEIDPLYRQRVLKHAFAGPRDLRVLYSPLHGVGLTSVGPVLQDDQFAVDVYAPQATLDGDFPNVPDQVANPENPAVFDDLIAHAASHGHELVLASDPDADRLGAAAPRRLAWRADARAWQTFNGHQLAVLLAEYLLHQHQQAGQLTAEHYLVKTLVTTEMLTRQAEAYGIAIHGELLTGFKWIGGLIEELGPERFVFAAEEAHGYLAGDYIRDKCGAVAAMLLAEYAAWLKPHGLTLHEELDRLYGKYGMHLEQQRVRVLPGAAGQQAMAALVTRLREQPPETLGGCPIVCLRDYGRGRMVSGEGPPRPLVGPQADLLFFDLLPAGTRVAVRPSGTEPKLKFYLYAAATPAESHDLETTRGQLTERLAAIAADLEQL